MRDKPIVFNDTASRKINRMERSADPYVNLANSIVIQACEDYKVAYKRQLGRAHAYSEPDEEILELESFFRSEWCKVLTSVDGEYLMKRIQQEVSAQLS